MYYVNYNKHGQSDKRNSEVPSGVKVEGTKVKYTGTMSRKTADMCNEMNLVSHTVVGEYNVIYCVSDDAAGKVATILEQNPNYTRTGE